MMTHDFIGWMQGIQAQTESVLPQFLPDAPHSPQLHEAMRYAVLGGGKRLRALLVHAAAVLFDAPKSLVTRAAAAIEMMHAYSLVHDDMPCMDNDLMRRGKPAVHVKYGQAMALLAGDALQTQAFLILAQEDSTMGTDDEGRQLMRLTCLAKAAASMCEGQAMDLASIDKVLTPSQLAKMHHLKTGALCRAAVLLGAWCGANVPTKEGLALHAYADAVGLAFQVMDDILDATSDSATLGKTAGKDAVHHKPTYVSMLGLQASRSFIKKLQHNAHDALSIFVAYKANYLHKLADFVACREV